MDLFLVGLMCGWVIGGIAGAAASWKVLREAKEIYEEAQRAKGGRAS